MTKANTIQARRKFKKRWPFKHVRVSAAEGVGADDGVEFAAAALPSLDC